MVHQQEPSPPSPLLKIAPLFPPHSDLPSLRPPATPTPKELAVSIDPDVPHQKELGLQQNYL